jgi:hypothetical protein
LIFNAWDAFQQPLVRRRIELMLEKTRPLREGRKPAEGHKRQFLLTMDHPEVIKAIKLAAIENGSPRRPKQWTRSQGNGLDGENRN